jgi:hypothetical protein
LAENFIPDRNDFARIYTMLRKEYRGGKSILDMKGILRMVNHPSEEYINYTKCKFILRILNELNICEIEELNNDIYSLSVAFNATKTNIERSSILRKMKSQCIDRIH